MYDIIIIVIYTSCTSYLIVFHLFRLYKSTIANIESNIEKEEMDKWKIYPISKDKEYAACVICLNNEPIP